MIVKPKMKYRKFRNDEIRVINVDQKAVAELLWENLMESQERYFDTDPLDPDTLCFMDWDHKSGNLTYAILPIQCLHANKEIDFDALRQQAGITTSSLFQPNRYRRMKASGNLLRKR